MASRIELAIDAQYVAVHQEGTFQLLRRIRKNSRILNSLQKLRPVREMVDIAIKFRVLYVRSVIESA